MDTNNQLEQSSDDKTLADDNQVDQNKRALLKASYVTPAMITLASVPAFATTGSGGGGSDYPRRRRRRRYRWW